MRQVYDFYAVQRGVSSYPNGIDGGITTGGQTVEFEVYGFNPSQRLFVIYVKFHMILLVTPVDLQVNRIQTTQILPVHSLPHPRHIHAIRLNGALPMQQKQPQYHFFDPTSTLSLLSLPLTKHTSSSYHSKDMFTTILEAPREVI